MKPTLQFRLSQHLTLTPQLQQSIRLLQLSTVELDQEIERLLMENPLLERDEGDGEPRAAPRGADEPRAEEPRSDDAGQRADDAEPALDAAPSWRGGESDEDGERSPGPAAAPTLREHLIGQLTLINLDERDRGLASMLVDALDEDGYLTQSLDDIAAQLPPGAEIGLDELAIALRHLQNLEPAGVGARSPAECLALQLRAAAPRNRIRDIALTIVEKHLDLLAARNTAKLKSLSGASDEELRAAQQLIRGLNPRPGAAFSRLLAPYVVPDVIVRKQRNTWTASLNSEAMPNLRINRFYADMTARQKSSGSSLATQLQEARWLIRNIRQRFDTILRVAQAIVDRQGNFLDHGEVAMRPLVLREIAAALGVHESTISRVTTQKYMATPRGTFELKYFFGSHVATETGGAASSTAIRALIKQLIAAEDGRDPLSDATLARILGQQGIVVARRTVAKYRESLQIPPVNRRRAF